MTDEQIQKETKNFSKETTASESKEGSDNKTLNAIEQADATVKRLEEANAKKEELLQREEELLARKRLAGISEGAAQEEKPKEETAAEYKQRVMSGKI